MLRDIWGQVTRMCDTHNFAVVKPCTMRFESTVHVTIKYQILDLTIKYNTSICSEQARYSFEA